MSKLRKAVSMYEGKTLLAKFASMSLASELNAIDRSDIGKVVNGKRQSAGGYSWKSTRLTALKADGSVSQYDADNNLIATFNDVALASTITGVRASDINKTVSGKRKTAGGFVWS